MPHDIAMINGKPAMMFVGELPWHKLGTALESAPKTAAKAIEAANLDWKVDKKPVYAFDGGAYCAVPGYRATVRADLWGTPDCQPFGLVGEDYCVLQNRDAFNFFDPVVASGEVAYETAGALGRGERVWVLAKVHRTFAIKKTDEIEPYLLLSNGHDGRTAMQIRFTPVRVVCQNTLSAALASGSDLFRSHHGRGLDNRVEKVQAGVEYILKQYHDLEQNFQRFAEVRLDEVSARRYVHTVFPIPPRRANQGDRSYEEVVDRVEGLRKTGTRLYDQGLGNQVNAIRHTLWAAYNGVTELVDHHLAYANPWQRMQSVCFGEGERIKRRAFDIAVEFSKN